METTRNQVHKHIYGYIYYIRNLYSTLRTLRVLVKVHITDYFLLSKDVKAEEEHREGRTPDSGAVAIDSLIG